MGDFRRENARFSLKWGISEEKMHDIHLIGNLRRGNMLFLPKWGILEEKTRDFRLNGGFSKRKRMIFT